MRKPRYHYSKELGGKVEQERYAPTNESRDAYGNFKRQYRSKADNELGLPARSKIPRYEPKHSEYREQAPKERKAESQTRESETQGPKLSDELTDLRDEIEKSRQDLGELRRAVRADSRGIDEKLVELGIEKEIQKNIADFLDTGTNESNEQANTEGKETEAAEQLEPFFDANNLGDPTVTYPGELTREEAEALIKEIEESGFVDDEKIESRAEDNANLEEPLIQTEIEPSRAEQPSEVLDRLEQEMNYLEDHLSNNPTHSDSLPELMGDLFGAERRMNEVMDSIERAEPEKPIEPLHYEEGEEF